MTMISTTPNPYERVVFLLPREFWVSPAIHPLDPAMLVVSRFWRADDMPPAYVELMASITRVDRAMSMLMSAVRTFPAAADLPELAVGDILVELQDGRGDLIADPLQLPSARAIDLLGGIFGGEPAMLEAMLTDQAAEEAYQRLTLRSGKAA